MNLQAHTVPPFQRDLKATTRLMVNCPLLPRYGDTSTATLTTLITARVMQETLSLEGFFSKIVA